MSNRQLTKTEWLASLEELWEAAQRPWVGLTDEEIRAVNAQVSRIPPIDYTTFTYARAIEAKLKERNT